MDSPECIVQWRTIHHLGLVVTSQGGALGKQMACHFALKVWKKPGTLLLRSFRQQSLGNYWKLSAKNGPRFVFAPPSPLVFRQDSKEPPPQSGGMPGADKCITRLHKFISEADFDSSPRSGSVDNPTQTSDLNTIDKRRDTNNQQIPQIPGL